MVGKFFFWMKKYMEKNFFNLILRKMLYRLGYGLVPLPDELHYLLRIPQCYFNIIQNLLTLIVQKSW